MIRAVALSGLLAFVTITVVEHALEPQLDPASHTISEYVNTGAGPLMTFAFLAWAASLLATSAVARCRRPASGGPLIAAVSALLVIAAAGLLLTACFATQTSAGALPVGVQRSTGGHIHDLASGAAMQAMIVALVLSFVALRERRTFRRLALGGLAIAVGASVVLLPIGNSVDGVRQRVLVVIGCTWQAALVITLASPARDRPSGESSVSDLTRASHRSGTLHGDGTRAN